MIKVLNFTMKSKDLQLSNVFLQALNHLPLEYNYAAYSQIFENFGTHYFASGSLGGVYDILYQYSREELKNSGMLTAALISIRWSDSMWSLFLLLYHFNSFLLTLFRPCFISKMIWRNTKGTELSK